jgi:hypothetical protein
MAERMMAGSPVEPPLASARPAHPAHAAEQQAFDDARALTILNTEHWSLMSARGLVYNEAFARAGMFLAFLSATLVALGLVATATGFSDGFLSVAAATLALNLFIGFASLARIAAASGEDVRYLQGMNRLRHAYHEMVPDLERYFVTSKHDDIASVLSFYGPTGTAPVRGFLHGLTTTPGMIGVICAAVSGALWAIVAILLTHDPVVATWTAVGAFLLVFLVINAWLGTSIRGGMRQLRSIFPRTDWNEK